MPKKIGDKNIILVKSVVICCCALLKPGAINCIKKGAKITPKIPKNTNKSIKIFKILFVKTQAFFLSLIKPVKIGINPADKPPKTIILKIKSGIRKAAKYTSKASPAPN